VQVFEQAESVVLVIIYSSQDGGSTRFLEVHSDERTQCHVGGDGQHRVIQGWVVVEHLLESSLGSEYCSDSVYPLAEEHFASVNRALRDVEGLQSIRSGKSVEAIDRLRNGGGRHLAVPQRRKVR
jgi:hypothetical protein